MKFGFKNAMKGINKKYFSEDPKKKPNSKQVVLMNQSEAIWTERKYDRFASEAYIKNGIANRAINMIAESAASVNWKLFSMEGNEKIELKNHPILDILHRPNSLCSGAEFFRQAISYKLIGGNAYVLWLKPSEDQCAELFLLRPDRVKVLVNKQGSVVGYNYKLDNREVNYVSNPISNNYPIMHLKNFHPMDDYYGLSQLESAAFNIDLHNQANIWNQALLQNGARPSGALVVSDPECEMTEEQFQRIRDQLTDVFSGPQNAGRPLFINAGFDWREMSLSPKDLDFLDSKTAAARDIAMSLGVPPQILGIKGESTYNNYQEARLSFWEETVLPLLDQLCDSLNQWLIPKFGSERLFLTIDKDSISALMPRREALWSKIESANFLSVDEKRQILGFKPMESKE